MSDVNANIHIGIDSSQALGQLRALQSEISAFNRSIVAGNATAAKSQQMAMGTMAAQIGATKAFSTQITNVESSVSRLSRSIDKGKLSLGQYFKYGVASTKTFGNVFRKEHNEIMGVAADRVKRLQTQYVAMGKAQNGMTRSMAIRPLELYNAQQAIGIQKGQIFNKLLHDGSTSLVNFGKNTQWAGRQLMVGFTVPLTIFGVTASKVFMDLERQVINFKRVYGDLGTSPTEANAMVEQIKTLAAEYTKYGIAVKDTVELAADAAAAGAQGAQLMAVTEGATRLATLGMIDQQQALTATIALQSTFKMSAEELTQSVNFMNAVENQTVTSLDDITQAIPRVATTIQGLGGDVQDLSIFLTAMREGGVNAAEGANALKSGLASMINPTKAASEQLAKVGINMEAITNRNKGNVLGMVQDLGAALNGLDKFERQQTLAKVFGKYQFARLSALFENINKEGSQAQKVIDLTGASVKDLAALSEKELGSIEDAVGVKFTAAVEKLKLAIAPIGEQFLKIVTPLIDFGSKVADAFNNLSPGVKSFVTYLVAGVGIVAPAVLMLVGLFGNLAGNVLKGVAIFNSFFNRVKGGGSSLNYLSLEALDAMAAQASLEGQTDRLTASLNVQRSAANGLAAAYSNMAKSARAATATIPQGVAGTRVPRRYATGGFVAGRGNKDTEPALLTPGEFVVSKEAAQKNRELLSAMNAGKVGMYAEGTPIPTITAGGREIRVASTRSVAALTAMIEKAHRASAQIGADFEQLIVGLSQSIDKVSKAAVEKAARASSDQNMKNLFPRDSRWKAPKSIQSQHAGMRGAFTGSQAAVRNAVAGMGLSEGQMNNLMAIQASHIVPELDAGGNKVWNPKNLTPDLGAVNGYLETRVKRAADVWGKDIEGLSKKISARSGISADKVKVELERLAQGIHPISGEAKSVLAHFSDLDNEAAIAAQKAKKVKTSLGTTTGTRYQAVAAGAALRHQVANPDELAGVGYKSLKTKVTSASAKGAGTASPSKITQQQGKDVARGIAVGIKQGTPEAVAAAEQMGAAVANASDPNASQSGRKGRRGAGRPTGPSNRYDNSGEIIVGGANNQSYSPKTSGQQAYRDAGEGAGQAVLQTVKGVEEEAKPVKKGLKGMAGKLTGGMFALDGLIFGMSMMDNQMGEFAQKIMPAMFAIQGLTMMSSLLISPLGAVIAVLAGTAAVLYAFNKNFNNTKDAGVKMGQAMIITTDKINEVAEFYGNKMLVKSDIAQTLGTTDAKLSQAQEFLSSDAGKSMVEGFTEASKQFGNSDAAKQFANQLGTMVLQGAISNKQAKDLANALEQELGVSGLSANIKGELASLIGPDGKDVLKYGVTIAMNIQQENKDFVKGLQDITTGTFDEAIRGLSERNKDLVRILESQSEDLKITMGIGGWEWFDIPMGWTQGLADNALAADEDWQQFLKTALATGAALGGQVKQAYDNLTAAQTRLNQQREAASKIKNPKRREYELDVIKEQQKQLDILEKKTENSIRKTKAWFDTLNTAIQNKVLEGNQTAITSLYEGTSQMPFVDVLLGRTGSLNQEVRFNIELALSSGQLSPYAAEQVFAMMGDDNFTGANVSFAISLVGADDAGVFIEQLAQLDDKALVKEFLLDVPEQSKTTLKSVIDGITILNGLPAKIKKQITTESFGTEEAIRLSIVTGRFDKLPDDVTKKRLALFFERNFDRVNFGVRWFEKLPDSVQKTFLATYTIHFNETGQLTDAGRAAFNNAYGKDLGYLPFTEQDKSNTVAQDDVNDANASVKLNKTGGSPTPDPVGGSNTGGGGGDKTDPLADYKGMWKELNDKLKMYTNILNVIKRIGSKNNQLDKALSGKKGGVGFFGSSLMNQMRKSNLSEGFIESLASKGYDQAKKIYDTLKKRNKLQTANKAFIMGEAGNTVSDAVGAQRDARAQQNAIRTGTKNGLSPELVDMIGSDSKVSKEFNLLWQNSQKDIKGADAAYSQFVNNLQKSIDKAKEVERALAEINQTAAEAYSSGANQITDALDIQINEIEQANSKLFAASHNGQTPEDLEAAVDTRNAEIKVLEHMVKKVEDLNKADEDRISDLNKAKDALNRQIDVLERANQLDQRRIDDLRREDELRGRVADALGHELELMSRQEQVINTAYQARLDALDKVAQLNDHILESQQQQLNIGKALSEGDVYAAAQAAAEMQKSQVEYASGVTRAGLEQGQQNAINGLTTSGGLTRVQAEAQIQAIQDQSYQTSLRIRDIDDQIYNRNLSMLPLKDQQYELDQQIQAIQDEIAARNLAELDTYQQQINALLAKNEQAQIELDKLDEKNKKDTEAMTAKLASLTSEVGLQEKINAHVTTIEDMTGRAQAKAAALAASWGDVAANALAASLAMGSKSTKEYTGGRIKGYAVGSVVGNGARDSVAAMLTPGEFVVRKAMVDKYGPAMFEKINQGAFSVPRYSGGSGGSASMPSGGSSGSTSINAPVYNSYSVNVSASTNASPDDIARTVIAKIKTIESSSIRRVNGY